MRTDTEGNIMECMVSGTECTATEWWDRYTERSNDPLAGYTVSSRNRIRVLFVWVKLSFYYKVFFFSNLMRYKGKER